LLLKSKLKKIVIFVCFFFVSIYFFSSCNTANAKDINDSNIFTTPRTENKEQIRGIKGYYSLKVKENKLYTISAVIKNDSSKSNTYKAYILDSFTNDSGNIVYKFNSKKSKKISSIEKLVVGKTSKTYLLKPHSKKKISFKINSGVNHPQGTYLGALKVSKINTKNSNQMLKQQISNTFSLELTYGDKIMKNNYNKIYTKCSLEKNKIHIKLINNYPGIISNCSENIQILSNSEENLYNNEQSISMAPFTQLNQYVKKSDLTKTIDGKYVIKLKLMNPNKNDLLILEKKI